jgi:GntP family gluconate:H+ symporter
LILASRKKGSKEGISSQIQAALNSGGGIILITAAGGAFGGMLQQTGISSQIADMTQRLSNGIDSSWPFMIAAIVRTAQGSATVALITASGILSGMAMNSDLAFHPVYLG